MGASQFVGRVGGLAVALGVGAAVFSTAGVASADRGSDSGGASASSSDSSASSAAKVRRGSAASGAASNTAPKAAATAEEVLPEATALVAEEPDVQTATDPVVDLPEAPQLGAEPKAAPADEIQTLSVTGAAESSSSAGTGAGDQTGNPLADAFAALATRRDGVVTPTAAVTADAPLTADPKVTYFDGVLQGNLNVVSQKGCGGPTSDCSLSYSFVGSSNGGKLDIQGSSTGAAIVPVALNPLLPDGSKGGAGSFTTLPYATWINPDKPVNFPTPTGSETFKVRVAEVTAFDKAIINIPLVGMIAKPVIDFLQDLPLVSTLLAPLIGSAIVAEVPVDITGKVAAGKQVAYTYKVTSFDGVEISMNYFPAAEPSLVLPGQRQATIFNGPGLGSPGETKPYGLFQAAGSVPGLGLMRGQGLPAPFDKAPLGFNVITWDPRGEFASGGVLQLDNPFFEGRDVSSLITWADANTPLLSEGGKPDVAMMGGSYGGGIQMTTIDPRVKTIVPSIAWNSLNNSLYPTNVFKTAWANTLALALLQADARINPLIQEGIIYGNLFGFLTDSQQAALASSGPTALLTKLSIPTMYDQGIIDALFPLQQAIDNAQTQLEQNPYFAGANADKVAMLWFCGGHGVCTTQTTAQQTKQAETMFLENMIWVNNYAKDYIKPFLNIGGTPAIDLIAPFSWWDQKGKAWVAFDMPWTDEFATGEVKGGNLEGGQINSFTSRSGPLKADDAAGEVCKGIAAACEFPLNQVFATEAKNAVEATIPIPAGTDPDEPDTFVVGAPRVSFSYSGVGNAKAVYAQVVDTATGQVLGNINTAIPVILDGKDHEVLDFPIANIVYSGPLSGQGASSLKLQIVANSSLYQNNAVIWSAKISDLSVRVPTTKVAFPNPIAAFLP